MTFTIPEWIWASWVWTCVVALGIFGLGASIALAWVGIAQFGKAKNLYWTWRAVVWMVFWSPQEAKASLLDYWESITYDLLRTAPEKEWKHRIGRAYARQLRKVRKDEAE